MVTTRESTSKVAAILLPHVLKVLYQRLSLTRGQIAIATELYVLENVSAQGNSVPEAIDNALKELGVEYHLKAEGKVLRVELKCGEECSLGDICPLPFYVAAYARKASSKHVTLISHKIENAGGCIIEYMVP